MCARSRHPAFTLLELLVVVGIVGALILLLSPHLVEARRGARRVACASNLRQLALAWSYYFGDHRDFLPRGYPLQWYYGGKRGIPSASRGPRLLNRYLNIPPVSPAGSARADQIDNATRVFRCQLDQGSAGEQPSFYIWRGNSYPANEYVIGPEFMLHHRDNPCYPTLLEMNQRWHGWRTAPPRLTTPANRLVLLADAGWTEYGISTSVFESLLPHAKTNRFNVAFLDGSARLIAPQKGIYYAADYELIPFYDLSRAAAAVQRPVEEWETTRP